MRGILSRVVLHRCTISQRGAFAPNFQSLIFILFLVFASYFTVGVPIIETFLPLKCLFFFFLSGGGNENQ